MDELDDRVLKLCQKVIRGEMTPKEAERESFELIELMETDDRRKEAPDLFGTIPKEVIADRIGRIGRLSGFGIEGHRFLGGGVIGAFILFLRNGERSDTIMLKLTDGDGDELGARLASAVGLSCPAVYTSGTDHEYMLMDNVSLLSGGAVLKSGPEGSRQFVAEAVSMFDDVIAGKSKHSESFRGIMDLEGRENLFEAWLDYIELCRIGLIGDRQHKNTAIAFSTKTKEIALVPIDLDAVAHSVVVKKSGEPYLETYHFNIANYTRFMIKDFAAKFEMPKRALVDEFRSIVERRKTKEFVGIEKLKERICTELKNPRNIGIDYGLCRKAGAKLEYAGELQGSRDFNYRSRFTQSDCEVLCRVVEEACGKRQAFLDIQLRALDLPYG
jgi:hypothetical protein